MSLKNDHEPPCVEASFATVRHRTQRPIKFTCEPRSNPQRHLGSITGVPRSARRGPRADGRIGISRGALSFFLRMVDHGTLRAVSESDSYNKQKQTRTNFESGPSGASRLGFATRGLRVRKERDSPVVLFKKSAKRKRRRNIYGRFIFVSGGHGPDRNQKLTGFGHLPVAKSKGEPGFAGF